MFDLKSFYSTYQYDYYVYKLVTLKSIIDNVAKFEKEFLEREINDYIRDDYLRTLKSEIRQTLYHSIETVFELIFALTPPDEKHFDDKVILAKLTKANWRKNYQKIKDIANNNGLEFFNRVLKIQKKNISVSRYLFYFGIFADNRTIPKDYLDLIEPSIKAIKLGIKIISKEFTDRKEYNSYKHAMRIIPALKHFYILNAETKKSIIDCDLTDSMTFLHFDDDDDKIQFVTKLFDTKRDIALALFCSNLISNMILLRKAAFRLTKEEEKIPILFFGEEEVKRLNKFGVAIQNLTYRINK